MKILNSFKYLLKKLYVPALIFVTLQGIIITILLYDNRGRIKSQLIKYDLIEILTRNSSLDTLYFKDYFSYLKDIFNPSNQSTLDRLDLAINFKDFIALECSRKEKENCSKDGWIRGPKIIHNNQIYDVKLRAKGDRKIHKENIKKMSFKVDLRGDKKIYGMEEFSLQLPVIRNYSMEPLVSNLMREQDLISPRNKYVKFYMNGEYLGIRHIEEGFGKEIVENSKRRYGPIFSLDEGSGKPFMKNSFDLHDRKNWTLDKNNLSKSGLSILRHLQNKSEDINLYFDIENWAKYFAMLDSFNMIHGTLPKSVKFYLNPITGLFEPIFFDGHFGIGLFDNFLLSDFIGLDNSLPKCRYTCNEVDFYRMFFGNGEKVNRKFVKKYLYYLKIFSSEKYIENKFNKQWEKLSGLRANFYREFNKRDQAYHQGIFPHVAPKTRIYERLRNIRNYIEISEKEIPNHSFDFKNNIISIENINSKIPQNYKIYCESKKPLTEVFIVKDLPVYFNIKKINEKCNYENIKFSINGGVIKNFIKNTMVGDLKLEDKLKDNLNNIIFKNQINENILINSGKVFIKKDKEFINKKIIFSKNSDICFIDNSILYIKDSEVIIKGDKNNPTIFAGCEGETGSVVIENSKIKLGFLITKNLSFPLIKLRSLYGGINIINSNLEGDEIFVYNSKSEDAVNIINSKVKLNSINFQTIKSDALDSDFSSLNIGKISCKNIGNDCLDFSFSQGTINLFEANLVKDKVVSLGEKSIVKINKLNALKSDIGIVSKDESNLYLDKYYFNEVKIPISAYIKKNEFKSPKISIAFIQNKLNNDFLEFISFDSEVTIGNKRYIGNNESRKISELLYGNFYGVKTKR